MASSPSHVGYKDEPSIAEASSEFRKAFKSFRNFPSDDPFYQLIDFDKPRDFDVVERKLPATTTCSTTQFESLRLQWPPTDWTVYEVPGKPGFMFLKNPFSTPSGHFYWAKRCLLDYARSPNATNVDGWLNPQVGLKDESIFDNAKLLKKLRWATLGYHHDWNTKVYDPEKRSRMPDDLSDLSCEVAKSIFGDQSNFRAEAAIVNFYRLNSTLAGHVDRSEWNLDSPLLSFSFGQSAVFLLGGRTLDEKPIAVKIKSGDVVIMDGECRLAYHGVPRILKDVSWIGLEAGESDFAIAKYLDENRINMNVRQVN